MIVSNNFLHCKSILSIPLLYTVVMGSSNTKPQGTLPPLEAKFEYNNNNNYTNTFDQQYNSANTTQQPQQQQNYDNIVSSLPQHQDVTLHQQALQVQQQLQQYNEQHKLQRPSINDKQWSAPWKYYAYNTPYTIDIPYNISRSVITLVNSLYPSYLTYRAIERKDKASMIHMLVYWTVTSSINGISAVTDIWMKQYSNNTIYQIATLSIKLLPTVIGIERLYKIAIRPFYRLYVQDSAEKLIAELDELQKQAKSIAAQAKDTMTDIIEHHNDYNDGNNNINDLTTQQHNNQQSNNKTESQHERLVDVVQLKPSIDDADRRMLNYATQQVKDLDRTY